MVDNLIHEITVVADDNDATGEVLEVFFQNLKRLDVEVVGGFVEYEEVGILHQYGAEIELALLATGEFIDVVVLLLGGKEEMLEEQTGGEMAPASQVDIFGNAGDDVDDFLVVTKLQSFLREIAKTNGIANVELTAVGGNFAEKHFDEGGFARAVIAHDSKREKL